MIAWFDIFSGISGDMTLGAFVHLGVPIDWLKKKIASIPLQGFDIRAEDIWHSEIKGVNLFVDIDKNCHAKNYKDIKTLILKSCLSDKTKNLSLSAFKKIAIAESQVHGTDIEKIHFHELGGVDAIVDIVGAFLCIEYLKITHVYAPLIPLGTGFVKCRHGVIPVPAPATLEILKKVPVKNLKIPREIVTPTGAAIITTLVNEFGPIPDMIIDKIGYGSGKNKSDSKIPNFLRIITGHKEKNIFLENDFMTNESVFVVETLIDDMNPEIFSYVMEQIFKENALDLYYIPVQMKKNRPGIKMEVLCKKQDLQNIINLIFKQTTTTGVRYHKVKRTILKRKKVFVKTRFGNIQVKKITQINGTHCLIPEYEICRNIAEKEKIPLKHVYSQISFDIK